MMPVSLNPILTPFVFFEDIVWMFFLVSVKNRETLITSKADWT
jgi:hypothetical protein